MGLNPRETGEAFSSRSDGGTCCVPSPIEKQIGGPDSGVATRHRQIPQATVGSNPPLPSAVATRRPGGLHQNLKGSSTQARWRGWLRVGSRRGLIPENAPYAAPRSSTGKIGCFPHSMGDTKRRSCGAHSSVSAMAAKGSSLGRVPDSRHARALLTARSRGELAARIMGGTGPMRASMMVGWCLLSRRMLPL